MDGQIPYRCIDYAGNKEVAALSAEIEQGNPEVIAKAAGLMAKIVPPDSVLVPMPGKTGKPDAVITVLTNAIAALAGVPVADVLRGNPQQNGTMNMETIAPLPNGRTPLVVDNKLTNGLTAKAATDVLDSAQMLVVTSDSRAKNRLRELTCVAKQNQSKILLLQMDGNEYKLHRFSSEEDMNRVLQEHSITVGKNVQFGNMVQLANNVSIGDEVKIGNDTILEAGSRVGNECTIAPESYIGRDSQLENNVIVGQGVEIGNNSIMRHDSVIAENAVIMDRVVAGPAAYIGKGVEIRSDTTLGLYANVKENSHIGEHVHIGADAIISAGQTVSSFSNVDRNNGITKNNELKEKLAKPIILIFPKKFDAINRYDSINGDHYIRVMEKGQWRPGAKLNEGDYTDLKQHKVSLESLAERYFGQDSWTEKASQGMKR